MTHQLTESTSTDSLPRRTVLRAAAATAGALAVSGPAAARVTSTPDDRTEAAVPVDEPAGFEAEVLAGHAGFPDEVAASFRVTYDDGGTVDAELPCDASGVVFARVTWCPGGTSGWHTHPGPVIVSVTDGTVELVNERDCVVRSYSAGDAFLDPGQGNVHVATNPSTSEHAVAYATFFGVPDGAPATTWVRPVDCESGDR